MNTRVANTAVNGGQTGQLCSWHSSFHSACVRNTVRLLPRRGLGGVVYVVAVVSLAIIFRSVFVMRTGAMMMGYGQHCRPRQHASHA